MCGGGPAWSELTEWCISKAPPVRSPFTRGVSRSAINQKRGPSFGATTVTAELFMIKTLRRWRFAPQGGGVGDPEPAAHLVGPAGRFVVRPAHDRVAPQRHRVVDPPPYERAVQPPVAV